MKKLVLVLLAGLLLTPTEMFADQFNGKKIIVEEPMEEVVRQVVKYKRAWFK